MALRSPGLPPQVRSGLLGRYDPNMRQSVRNRITGGGAGGGGLQLNIPEYQMADMSQLTAKYMQDMPAVDVQTDPMEIYEGGMGGLRQDVQGAITEAGQRAISTAATSGREVADVMARYLPEAVKGYGRAAADVAGGAQQLAAQGKIAKSELELKRTGMAQEMARFEQAQGQQQNQFMTQLQSQYQMHREQLANNLAVARQQATSAAQLQSIQNAHQIQMANLNRSFQQQAMEFQASQQNMRHSQQLQLYDKYFGSQARSRQMQDITKAAGAIAEAPPTQTAPPAPSAPGAGTATYGGTTYRYNPNTGRFELQ